MMFHHKMLFSHEPDNSVTTAIMWPQQLSTACKSAEVMKRLGQVTKTKEPKKLQLPFTLTHPLTCDWKSSQMSSATPNTHLTADFIVCISLVWLSLKISEKVSYWKRKRNKEIFSFQKLFGISVWKITLTVTQLSKWMPRVGTLVFWEVKALTINLNIHFVSLSPPTVTSTVNSNREKKKNSYSIYSIFWDMEM